MRAGSVLQATQAFESFSLQLFQQSQGTYSAQSTRLSASQARSCVAPALATFARCTLVHTSTSLGSARPSRSRPAVASSLLYSPQYGVCSFSAFSRERLDSSSCIGERAIDSQTFFVFQIAKIWLVSRIKAALWKGRV